MALVEFKGREVEIADIDGVDPSDYPDFCDAYFSEAYYTDTMEDLTPEEMEELQEENSELLGEMAFEACIQW